MADCAIASERQPLDPATAHDQAQCAQAQADRTAAEKDLQQRIEFARQHSNAVVAYSTRSTPKEIVSDAFNRTLGVTTTTMTTSSFGWMGPRSESASACRGPLCCITTPSAICSRKQSRLFEDSLTVDDPSIGFERLELTAQSRAATNLHRRWMSVWLIEYRRYGEYGGAPGDHEGGV